MDLSLVDPCLGADRRPPHVRLDAEEDRLAFDSLLSILSRSFAGSSDEEINAGFQPWLKTVGECCGMDRATLVELRRDAPIWRAVHSWAADGVMPMAVPTESTMMSWIGRLMAQGEPVLVNSIDDLPPEAEMTRKLMQQHGSKSVAMIPLRVGDQVLGNIVFAMVKRGVVWTPLMGDRLAQIGMVFANVVARGVSSRRLRRKELEFEQITNLVPESLLILSRDLQIQFSNDRFAQLFGTTPEQIAGRDVASLLNESEVSVLRPHLELLFAGKEVSFEFKLWTATSGPSTFYARGMSVTSESGVIDRCGILLSDISSVRESDELLRRIVKGTSASTGQAFFRSLVEQIALALNLKFALVGHMVEDNPERVRVLSFYNAGEIQEGIEYDLDGTPCERTLSRRTCIYLENVQSLYPRDVMLVDLGVHCYAGTPLFASDHAPLGVLVVMHDRPLPTALAMNIRALLTIFARRASAELERIRVERRLEATIARLEAEHAIAEKRQAALSEILDHLEDEKSRYRAELCELIERLVGPVVERVERGETDLRSADCAKLRRALELVAEPEVNPSRDRLLANLTARELDVCAAIREGCSSKEIADRLRIDVQTVHKHRDSIREKLQLKHTGIGLAACLRSL